MEHPLKRQEQGWLLWSPTSQNRDVGHPHLLIFRPGPPALSYSHQAMFGNSRKHWPDLCLSTSLQQAASLQMPSKAPSRSWCDRGRPAYDTLRQSNLVSRLDPRSSFGEAKVQCMTGQSWTSGSDKTLDVQVIWSALPANSPWSEPLVNDPVEDDRVNWM